MKKLILTFVLLLTAAGLTFAQGPQAQGRTPEERASMQVKHMNKQLALSAEQQPKVKEVMLARANKMDACKALTDKAAKRTKMKEAKDEADAALKTILSAEQFDKYVKLEAEQMGKGKGKGKKKGNAESSEEM